MTTILNPQNHLFELARTGQRLPHIALAVVMSLVFILLSQFSGGVLALIIILLLSFSDGSVSFDNPDTLFESLLPNTAIEQTIFLVLAFGPIFFIVWGWLVLFEKRPFWTIGLEWPGAMRKYLAGFIIGVVMFALAIGLSAGFGYIAFEQGDPQQQGVAALAAVILVLIGWLVQGAAEEVITRGWLLPVIGARYKPVWGIVISSVIFSLFHLINPNLGAIAVLNLTLFGVFAALYALYEGGLWGVFSVHSAWNWAQGNVFGFEVSGGQASGGTLLNLMEVGPDFITGGAFGPEGGLSVTAVLVAGCLVVWILDRRKKGSTISLNKLGDR